MLLVGKPQTSATACAMFNLLNRAGPPMLYILQQHHAALSSHDHERSFRHMLCYVTYVGYVADTSRVELC